MFNALALVLMAVGDVLTEDAHEYYQSCPCTECGVAAGEIARGWTLDWDEDGPLATTPLHASFDLGVFTARGPEVFPLARQLSGRESALADGGQPEAVRWM